MKWEKENKKFKPELILHVLNDCAQVNDDGIFFSGFDPDEFYYYIDEAVIVSSDIYPSDKLDIIRKSIVNIVKENNVSLQNLEKEITKNENEYLSKTPEELTLVTGLSVKRNGASNRQYYSPTIRINNCEIRFPSHLHTTFHEERDQLNGLGSIIPSGEYPKNYLPVTVTLEARTFSEAANKALDQINLIRGIWNYIHGSMFHFSTTPSPINKILLGPIHSLHLPSKKLATQAYWYEPFYKEQTSPFDLSMHNKDSHKLSLKIKRKIRTSNYNLTLETIFRKYVESLDNPHMDISYIQLWNVLEILTNTTKADYNTAVKRTAFVWEESEYHFQIINRLRHARNKSVHYTIGSGNTPYSDVFLLKKYVDQLIKFHLWNRYDFSNISEACEFLSLSPIKKNLAQQKKTISDAIHFRATSE